MKIQRRYFKKAVGSFKGRFFVSTSLSVLCALLNVLIPVILRNLIQGVGSSQPFGELLGMGLLIVLCIVSSIAVTIALYVSLDFFGGLFIKELGQGIRKKLFAADMSFVDAKGSNRICHILYNDVLDIFRVIGHHFPMLIGSVFIIIGTLLLSLQGSVYISLFLVASVSIGIVISMVSRKAIYKASAATNAKLKGLHGLTDQFSQTILSAKVNGESSYYDYRFSSAVDDFIAVSRQEDKKIYLFYGLTNNFNLVMEILLSVLVSIPIAGRSIPNYVFYVFIFSLTMKQGERIEGLLQQIIRSEVCFRNVDEILGMETPQRNIELEGVSSVCFEDVSFSYGGVPVLEGFDLCLSKGDAVLLGGGNGVGKSTVLKLLRGLYDVKDGSLKLDGNDIRRVSMESLHRNILYVGQDEAILNETPVEYLLRVVEPVLGTSFGDLQARDVLKRAGVEDLESPIHENGESLSGGQRKKLLFAKLMALCDFSSVVLIDELHAGLDVGTKAMLDGFINELVERKNKIVVVVSHEDVSGIDFNRKERV